MLSGRDDLGIGATIDIDDVSTSQKTVVACLLAVAICKPSIFPNRLFIMSLSSWLKPACSYRISRYSSFWGRGCPRYLPSMSNLTGLGETREYPVNQVAHYGFYSLFP